MTDVQTERPDAPDVGPASPPEVVSPPVVSRERARRQRSGARKEAREGDGGTRLPRRTYRGTKWFALASVLCIGALTVMLWQGWETAKEIKGGNRLHQVNDPAKPGYQEEVLPTASRLIGQLDADGHLADLVLLTSPTDTGGEVVYIPSTMVVARDGQFQRLYEVYEKSGWPSVVDSVGRFLGAGVTQTALMTTDQAKALLASVPALDVNNSDAVLARGPNNSTSTLFKAGALQLTPEQAVRFMTTTGVDESPVQRSGRQQLVWDAYLAAVAKDPSKAPAVAPLGEGDGAIDLSAVVKQMAGGTVQSQPLPIIRVPLPGGPGWAVDPETIPDVVARIMPFPSSSYPGQRPRVRILDATQTRDHILEASSPVVGAGGQITVLGNADRFGEATTRIEYHSPEMQQAAEKIAQALGNRAAVRSPDQTDAFDVTVTLGADFSG